jgi:hypothetical protein
MTKFLFVYRNGTESSGKLTPEEMQGQMQKWQTWLSQGIQKGWLVEAGDALKREGRVVNAKRVVTDGPFVEAKDVVGGFSIVKADSLDAAAEHAKGCPGLLVGGTVEVRQLAGFTIQG